MLQLFLNDGPDRIKETMENAGTGITLLASTLGIEYSFGKEMVHLCDCICQGRLRETGGLAGKWGFIRIAGNGVSCYTAKAGRIYVWRQNERGYSGGP